MTIQTKPRILVNRSGALGDVILATPIVRKLYQDRGGMCEIHARTFHVDVFRDNPYVARVLHARDPLNVNEYDLIINLDLVYEKNPRMHILDAYAHYAFGNVAMDRHVELFPSEDDAKPALEVAAACPNGYVAIHMRRTFQGSRNLPESFWRQLVIDIVNETGLNVVQVGGPEEHAFGGSDRLIDMRGKLSIHQLREVFARAQCYIGVDSAPLHVAATTGTDMIAFFTTARAEYRLPYREKGAFRAIVPAIDCYGCQERLPLGSTMVKCERGDEDCVNRFSVSDVTGALKEFMSRRAGEAKAAAA